MTTPPSYDPNTLSPRQKRLVYRSWHRGMKENDLLLGNFANQNIAGMSDDDLAQYEAVLEHPDPVLHRWYVTADPVPPEFETPMLRRILNFKIVS